MSEPLIVWVNLPFPCSDNRAHRTGSRSFIRFKSKEYTAFESEMTLWAYENKQALEQAKESLQIALESMPALELIIRLKFEKSRVLTKKNTLKRIDASNFIKVFNDKLSQLLGIDDSIFFKVTVEKTINTIPGESKVDISISSLSLDSQLWTSLNPISFEN